MGCGKRQRESGKIRCLGCLKANKKSAAKRQARLKAAGICISCGKSKAPNGYYCDPCHQKQTKNSLFRNARARAKKKGLPFTINRQDIYPRIDAGICEATKLPFDTTRGCGPWSPSLDRIDPNYGYEPDNVMVVCWAYNSAKNVFTYRDLLKLAYALVAADQDESA